MQLTDPLDFNDVKLFHSLLNDRGYVLDLNSAQFDALTQQTIGYRATERYSLSKGKSLFKLLSEEPAAQTLKLMIILERK